jgi:hypothetical protein
MKNLKAIGKENYFATTCGRLYHLRYGKLKRIKGYINPDGYIRIDLRNKRKGTGKMYFLHNLIMIAFHDYYGEVDHINRIKTDNRLSNITAITRSENVLNRDKTNGRITEEELNLVEKYYKIGLSLVKIQIKTGLGYQQVRRRIVKLKQLGRV